MIETEKYQQIHLQEASGSHGTFGIKILAYSDRLDLAIGDRDRAERGYLSTLESITSRAGEQILHELMATVAGKDPKSHEQAAEERKNILACFLDPIYVEEIPNGYCSQWCCRHLPWFIVTTSIGHFKIGWRKRVINIDWTRTIAAKTDGETMFPDVQATKSSKFDKDRYVHAYSYEDAKRYIATIIASTQS